ncbi:spermine/spermidine synthase domain-containing protein [Aquimarina sediminis]|uniref:spermine/spermidine synthase domain-containing protein n=1 Tax=Aquimarina sediminis TaxID=2070536 RepID=UPI000CA06F79|nr:spermine synthase [Aquimarina sediminis]
MKKLLSYLWPFTKEIPSKINGTLELTWMNGKKVLDSQNANHSYGTLQKLLNYGLSQIRIPPKGEILLLGLGGGSIIQTLRNSTSFSGSITAVEIDEIIIEIAKNEFGIKNTSDLRIICDDAYGFIDQCITQFDIIIIDIFIDNKVPQQFYDLTFWAKIMSLIRPTGYVLFNAGINLKENTNIELIKSMDNPNVEFTQYNNVQGTNTLLIGKKGSES